MRTCTDCGEPIRDNDLVKNRDAADVLHFWHITCWAHFRWWLRQTNRRLRTKDQEVGVIPYEKLNAFINRARDTNQACEEIIAPWRMRLRRSQSFWTLAMRLHPYGSNSTQADWEFLGALVGYIAQGLGYAFSKPIEAMDETHPNEALHWVWPSSYGDEIQRTNGPVKPLPIGWRSTPFAQEIGKESVLGVQYDNRDLRVVVTDEPDLGPIRHISASCKSRKINANQIEIVRKIFAYPNQQTILDAVNPANGIWHLRQERPDEFGPLPDAS